MRLALALARVVVASGLLSAPAQAATAGQVRLDQVGYGTAESKQTYLLVKAPTAGATFSVLDDRGRTALSGRVGASLGSWSADFGAVHPIDFTKLTKSGTYKIKLAGATSPTFKVDSTRDLFTPLAANTVEFFQAQRDGANVIPGRLGRKRSTSRTAARTSTPPRCSRATAATSWPNR